MPRYSLFRRRQVWLPTLFGWLLLIAGMVMAAVIVLRFIHPFLSPNEPAPAARLLVVEGWMTAKELDQALLAFKRGRYERLVTTGGPIERWPEALTASSYAELAASYFRARGLASAVVSAVPAPASAQDRTFLSAVKVRQWADKQGLGIAAFDVFTVGTHGRRSRMLYRMAFGPRVDVGILSVKSSEYDAEQWWRGSAGAKSVMAETISLIWTVCCFDPPAQGSPEEMWGVPR